MHRDTTEPVHWKEFQAWHRLEEYQTFFSSRLEWNEACPPVQTDHSSANRPLFGFDKDGNGAIYFVNQPAPAGIVYHRVKSVLYLGLYCLINFPSSKVPRSRCAFDELKFL